MIQLVRQLEQAAREEINARAGRIRSDEEWSETRTRLIAFMNILRVWEQATKTDHPDGGKNMGRKTIPKQHDSVTMVRRASNRLAPEQQPKAA